MRSNLPNATPPTDEVTDRRPRHAASRRVGIIATGAVCLLLALFAVLFMRGPNASGSILLLSSSAPAGWQTYRDPAGLFAVQLPPGWTAHVETGTSSFGGPTGSATETDETISFGDPSQGSASAAVYVDDTPIHTDFERQWYCQASRSDELDSFHGYPALTMPATWIFESNTAHFQLAYMIPGVVGPLHTSPAMTTLPPTPTPLPQRMIDDDKTIVDTILATFQPTGTRALSC